MADRTRDTSRLQSASRAVHDRLFLLWCWLRCRVFGTYTAACEGLPACDHHRPRRGADDLMTDRTAANDKGPLPQYLMGSDGMGKRDVPDYITARWVDRAVRTFWRRLSDG